jgi:Macrocin-O-methyltransferase (TylF)
MQYGALPMNAYDQDGLRSVHNHEFMTEPEFGRAYLRGVQAARTDYCWHWRVHVGLWAASCAIKLRGDFVECGVNRGFLSSAIMASLDWNSTGRTFYLLDTFKGVDPRYLSDGDRALGVEDRNQRDLISGFYVRNVSEVVENFSEWPLAKIIEGSIPETLIQIDSQEIAFLHLDLNCSLPEVAAIESLWERLTPGAMVLMDDYAYLGYESQKHGMDEYAKKIEVPILSLPTGQGLLIKPASSIK